LIVSPTETVMLCDPLAVRLAVGEVQLLGAAHGAFVPPPEPSQYQVHGPVPDTAVAVPALQRLVVGALDTGVPLAEPQTPLTGVPPQFGSVAACPSAAQETSLGESQLIPVLLVHMPVGLQEVLYEVVGLPESQLLVPLLNVQGVVETL
jgi:hypothetical protein